MDQEFYSDDNNDITQEVSSQNNNSEQDVTDVINLVISDRTSKKKRSIVHFHFTLDEQKNEYKCNHCR
jgi:hypothetical protein